MILREAIEQYHGKTIRIGASTSFIYIGPADVGAVEVAAHEERLKAERALKEALDKMVTAHDTNFLIRMKLSLASSMRALIDKNERIRYGLIEDDAGEPGKKFKGGRIRNPLEIARSAAEDFVALNDKYQAQLLASYARVTDYAERMSPWIAILERPVKEVYKSIDPATKGDIIIIIGGKEAGDYWFEEEYRRAHI